MITQVELACGDNRVASLMSCEAADEPALAPGVAATAVIKSTNVVIETDRAARGPTRPAVAAD